MEDELSLMMEEENAKEVTRDQQELLYNQVEELKCSNAALLAEIDMFERFIGRMDPEDLVSQAGVDCPGAAGGASQLEDGGRGRRRRTRISISDRLQQLTMEQKLCVAQREVTETRQDRENVKQRYEKIQDNYKASMKEAELRLADIRKAKIVFERRLLKPIKEPEKVLQYIEDKSKVAQLENFNLKNQALKVYEKKLQQQLQQKKEMGKAEHEYIFQEYSEQRIDKNVNELQVNSVKVQRVLSSHKDKLQRVALESTELSNDIINRKQMLANIEEEIQNAEEERLKAKALNQHLRRQMTDYHTLDITEYMQVKDKRKKLQQSIHTWERKVGVAEMALKTNTKAQSTQRATLPPTDRAEAGARSEEHRIPVKLPYIAEHST